MTDELDRDILDVFGVDTAKLVEEHSHLLLANITCGHDDVIGALALAITWGVLNNAPHVMKGAADMLFAVGYAAGKSAPDLSVFEGVLEDGE